MQKMCLESSSMRPTPFTGVPILSRTELTAWPLRSPSWTPAWRRVSSQEASCLISYHSLILTAITVKGTFLCLWFAVSLQDINLRKAFKSSTVQDQKVLSKESTPDSVAEMHCNSDRPPPLSTLSAYRYRPQHLDKLHFSFNPHFISIIFFYREDSTDAMKFYSDPSYFFDLWKEKMLQDTEDKRRERRRQRVGVHSALIIVHLCVLQCVFHFFSVPSSNSSRSRSAAWKAALFSGR